MGRRTLIPLVLLALLVAPVAMAWCSTVCVAMAISSGCAHELHPTDDLPVEKLMPSVAVSSPRQEILVMEEAAPPLSLFTPVPQRTPLRI